LQYRDTIMLVTRREPDARQRFHQRQAIWVGGHLRWEDVVDSKGPTLMEALKTCLRRELEEEICLRQPVDINYKGLCYDRSHPRSLRHLAVVFHAQVPKAVMESLNKKAYREPAGQELYLEFVPIDQRVIEQSVRSVEPWSADILKALYGIVVPTAARGEQLLLF
jgi:predicted NUDIX family phosphoesterase